MQLGCFLAIALHFSGAFTQQAIRYDICSFPIANATVGIALATGDKLGGNAVYVGDSIGSKELNVATMATIINTIADPDHARLNLTYGCSTGNCTLQNSYSTLGFCSKCADTTGKLIESSDGWQSLLSLPNGPSLANSSFPTMNLSSAGDIYQGLGLDNEFADVFPATIANYSMLTLTGASCIGYGNNTWSCNRTVPTSAGSWDQTNFVAVACSLYVCMQTYDAIIDMGELKENLASTKAALRVSPRNYFPANENDFVGLASNCKADDTGEDLTGSQNIERELNLIGPDTFTGTLGS